MSAGGSTAAPVSLALGVQSAPGISDAFAWRRALRWTSVRGRQPLASVPVVAPPQPFDEAQTSTEPPVQPPSFVSHAQLHALVSVICGEVAKLGTETYGAAQAPLAR